MVRIWEWINQSTCDDNLNLSLDYRKDSANLDD